MQWSCASSLGTHWVLSGGDPCPGTIALHGSRQRHSGISGSHAGGTQRSCAPTPVGRGRKKIDEALDSSAQPACEKKALPGKEQRLSGAPEFAPNQALAGVSASSFTLPLVLLPLAGGVRKPFSSRKAMMRAALASGELFTVSRVISGSTGAS